LPRPNSNLGAFSTNFSLHPVPYVTQLHRTVAKQKTDPASS
jgi:hypothetical protein